ncbi:MAG TPA: dihydrolipoyl dehydrogenase [Candidatus Omnitrophota bacterium]|nr:dihydrolipoyl dehydrogenase [Candidatus Omnitrophota bacterium]
MDYDLSIVGAGWAGFNAAITARGLGLKVLLIEKADIGGTCLNTGCIPTKALIQSAKALSLVKKSDSFGINLASPSLNFLKIQERKLKIIQVLKSGMQARLKGIDFLKAEAQVSSSEELVVDAQKIKSKNIIIASGSRPMEIGAFKFDGKKILSSDDILNLKEIPRSLLIIGGGVVGSEFASLFSALGTQVEIVEKMPQLLPGEDIEIARKLTAIFKKKGIKVNTNTDAASIDLNNYELVLLAVGRAPNTDNLGLDKIGLNLERRKILVDEYLRTNIANIYSAGDCTGKIMLAHYAGYQGRIAAGNIADTKNLKKASTRNVPSCIFTDPEISSVGLTEEEARQEGLELKVYKFDFLASGMARILEETDGFIKITADKKTGRVIGSSLIGPRATELVGILTLAISAGLTVPQLQETIFAHPTLSESISEALAQ